jgi:hypothetical protein
MEKLTVNLKIPILVEGLIEAPALTFYRWLPLGRENGIAINENDFEITLWFDIEATRWASVIKEEDLERNINVLAHYLFATIEFVTGDMELLNYIKNKDYTRLPNKEEKELQEKYEKFGEAILKSTLERVNRLISYARDIKGQYWLKRYIINLGQSSQIFINFNAKACINEENWFRFSPGATYKIESKIESESRYILKDEWSKVKDFVRSEKKAPAFGELISNAEELFGNGFLRSAITEATSALEISINKFGDSRVANDKLSMIYSERIGIQKLKNQIEHLGVSGTINYLLPLILTEDILPTEVLEGCQLAIELRNNILHNGQRKIEQNETRKCISSIRGLNIILESFMS